MTPLPNTLKKGKVSANFPYGFLRKFGEIWCPPRLSVFGR
jgi:hypothetical protein